MGLQVVTGANVDCAFVIDGDAPLCVVFRGLGELCPQEVAEAFLDHLRATLGVYRPQDLDRSVLANVYTRWREAAGAKEDACQR